MFFRIWWFKHSLFRRDYDSRKSEIKADFPVKKIEFAVLLTIRAGGGGGLDLNTTGF